jgi:hypothetical protein
MSEETHNAAMAGPLGIIMAIGPSHHVDPDLPPYVVFQAYLLS